MSVILMDSKQVSLVASMMLDGRNNPLVRNQIETALSSLLNLNAMAYFDRYPKEGLPETGTIRAGNQCKCRDDVKQALRFFDDLVRNIGSQEHHVSATLAFLYKQAMRVAISEF